MDLDLYKIPAHEQVAALQGVASRYVAPVAFQPGDLVQPRDPRGTNETPTPWVVLEVVPDAPLVDGSRNNLRLATLLEKGLFVTWSEHWGWERYCGDGTPGAGLQ